MNQIDSGVCLGLLLGSVLQVSSALANSEVRSYTLSPTSALQWGASLPVSVHLLPSFRGLLLDGQQEKKNFSAWISRGRPDSFSNAVTVKREWAELIKVEKARTPRLSDLGCKPLSSTQFKCSFSLIPGGVESQFTLHATYWSSDSDLVTVRVRSQKSMEHAEHVMAQMKIDFHAEGKQAAR